jgi:hypothetical protein
MDDGSLGHHSDQEDRAHFATCAFSRPSCEVLVRGLAKLGIDAVLFESNDYPRLRLNSAAAERLFLLVAPYIPECMQHKLPERYRGHTGWLPGTESEYKPALVTQTIDSIAVDGSVVSERYDMATETQNYFAHGVLVHNCNARFVHDGQRLHVGTHRTWRKPKTERGWLGGLLVSLARRVVDALGLRRVRAVRRMLPRDVTEDSAWWTVAKRHDLANSLARVPHLVVYGEVYGKVQDLHYGVSDAEQVRLAIFDAFDTLTGRWLNWEEIVWTGMRLGVDVVPLVYMGPWIGQEHAKVLAEGKTTVPGADHVREGVVFRSLKERRTHATRAVLKVVGEGYLLRKEGDVLLEEDAVCADVDAAQEAAE